MNKGTIQEILSSLKSSSGKDFLNRLTLQLHKSIGSDYTFIARIDTEKCTSTTLSLVAHGEIAENFTYSLDYTPCADVYDNTICVYPENICSLYPKDQLLVDMKIEGYIGTPLHDSRDNVMGLIVGLYENKIEDPELVTSLFELFSGRISAEIQRMEHQSELTKLNNELEQKVYERTMKLQAALEQLKSSQEQLIENEKLAALGRLVAGVAHEVNTPLGVALLGNSTIENCYHEIKEAFDSGKLGKHALKMNLETINEAQEAVAFNLSRASELISNFKQLASDFHMDDLETIKVTEWINAILSSLLMLLNTSGIELIKHYPEKDIEITTFPSRLAQILTNIISNAVNHAFDKSSDQSKQLIIEVIEQDSGCTITLKDNGKGMEQEVISHIYDPFFTTKRGEGGTGLGMSIVRNLVIDSLKGSIEIESIIEEGTEVSIHLPREIKE